MHWGKSYPDKIAPGVDNDITAIAKTFEVLLVKPSWCRFKDFRNCLNVDSLNWKFNNGEAVNC